MVTGLDYDNGPLKSPCRNFFKVPLRRTDSVIRSAIFITKQKREHSSPVHINRVRQVEMAKRTVAATALAIGILWRIFRDMIFFKEHNNILFDYPVRLYNASVSYCVSYYHPLANSILIVASKNNRVPIIIWNLCQEIDFKCTEHL